LISALLSVLGVVAGFMLLNRFDGLNSFLLAFAAGGFIYIAASDLIPEIHEEDNNFKSIVSFLVFLAALVVMYILKLTGAE
jgi:zinc and cadmium transporter